MGNLSSISGHALEHTFTEQLALATNANFDPTSSQAIYNKSCYEALPNPLQYTARARCSAQWAAAEIHHAGRNVGRLINNTDQAGITGDVRDLYFDNGIGYSLKNNNSSIRHPRIGSSSNLLTNMGVDDGDRLTNDIWAVFQGYSDKIGLAWADFRRDQTPLLTSVAEKFYDACLRNSDDLHNIVPWITGRNNPGMEYYKITVKAKSTTIEDWTHPSSEFPTCVNGIQLLRRKKDAAQTTVKLEFDKGYCFTIRFHTASSRIQSSLKADIRLVGLPQCVRQSSIVIDHKTGNAIQL